MKLFCTECGNPNEYTVAKPKFCSACGVSMTPALGGAKPAPAQPSKSRLRPIEMDTDDEYGEEDRVSEHEVSARAQELAQTISPDDFKMGGEDGMAGVKLGNLLPRDRFVQDDSGRLARKPD